MKGKARSSSHRRPLTLGGVARGWTLVGLLATTLVAPVVTSAADEPVLEVAPASIELPPVGSVESWLVIHGPAEGALRDIALAASNDVGAAITMDPVPTTLDAGGAADVKVTVRAGPDGIRAGTIVYRLEYTLVPGPKPSAPPAPPVRRVASATQSIKPPAFDMAIEVKSVETSATTNQAGTFDVLVTNNSDSPATITVNPRDDPRSPPNYTVTLTSAFGSVLVAAHDTFASSWSVIPAERIQPGPVVVLVDVTASGLLAVRHAVASVSPKLAVFGVEEFTGPLGVPTFYLIPGLIILVTFALLSSWFGSVLPEKLETDSKQFWVVAIGLSLAMAYWIYPWITPLLVGERRSYLTGLGTQDVALMWALAIGIGALFYGLGWIIVRVGARDVPSQDDTPAQLLRKLSSANLTVGRTIATKKEGANGLLVQDKRAGQERYWLSPQIGIRWQRPAGTSPALEDAADRELKNNGSIKRLWSVVKEARQRGWVTLDWISEASFISGVESAPADDLTYGVERRLVTRDGDGT